MGMGNTLDKKVAAKPVSSDILSSGIGRESQPTTPVMIKPSPPQMTTTEHTLDWNVDMEVQLFYAMRGHKPVGVNRHFQMACIHEKFKNSVQKDVTSQQIWDHLDTMYDMAALHESEIIPFPNDEIDFVLPDEFAKQIEEKLAEVTTSGHGGSSGDASNGVVRGCGTNGAGGGSREVTATEDKDTAKTSSTEKSATHQGGKQTGSLSNRSKENRTSTSQQSSSAAATAAASAAVSTPTSDGGQEARLQAKRKRNARTQLDLQQSGSKPSSPASGASTPASATKRRRN